MPRGIKGSGPNSKIKRHYFLVSGEVEYVETEGAPPKYMKVNGVYVDVGQKIAVVGLAKIQGLLQMHFLNKYTKSHPEVATITDAVITSIAYLGNFTQDEFHKDGPSEEEPKEKKSELKVVMNLDASTPPIAEPNAVSDLVKVAEKVAEETKPVETPVAIPAPEAVSVTPEPVKVPLIEVPATPAVPVEAPKTA